MVRARATFGMIDEVALHVRDHDFAIDGKPVGLHLQDGSAIFDQLRRRYPGITVHTTNLAAPAQQYRELRERKVDLILGRIPSPIEDDVATEVWFQNRLYVVAGLQSRWSRRRTINSPNWPMSLGLFHRQILLLGHSLLMLSAQAALNSPVAA